LKTDFSAMQDSCVSPSATPRPFSVFPPFACSLQA
jgi:hypothetical protein